MTIQSQISKITYKADGIASIYTIPFYFIENEIAVYLNDNKEKLVLNKDYLIKTNNNTRGGEIEFLSVPPQNSIITILRDVPLTQLTTFIEGESFPAKDYEYSLDKIVMSLQMLKEVLDRTIKLTPTTTFSFEEFHDLISDINKNYDEIKKVPVIASSINSIYEELLTHANKELKIGPVILNVSDIVADTTYETYPYKLDISINEVTSNHVPTIIFSLEDAISSNYAPIAEAYDGYVRIYLKKIPDKELIEIPIIFLQ